MGDFPTDADVPTVPASVQCPGLKLASSERPFVLLSGQLARPRHRVQILLRAWCGSAPHTGESRSRSGACRSKSERSRCHASFRAVTSSVMVWTLCWVVSEVMGSLWEELR